MILNQTKLISTKNRGNAPGSSSTVMVKVISRKPIAKIMNGIMFLFFILKVLCKTK
ncbi:hypothetical protein [Pedobacter puniceum]|uniref:hypothetical protein n=1 Tax=Pedobacter puniceum TaxID=2666136 RepID=UPI0018A1BB20|nr:hypothetical protein [Pedobacter puniceum]